MFKLRAQFFALAIVIFGTGCTGSNLTVSQTPRKKPFIYRLHKTKLANVAEQSFEQELSMYCHHSVNGAHLRKEQEFCRCQQFLSGHIPFGQSFMTSEESRGRRQQLLHLLAEVSLATLEWPKDNRLLAFPEVELPQKIVCSFVPEKYPDQCLGSSYHFPQSTLGQRLVSRFIAQHLPLIDDPAVFQDLSAKSFVTAGLVDHSQNLGSLGIHLFPDFFDTSALNQMGILLHEAQHIDPQKKHVFCTHSPEYGGGCDATIGDGPYAQDLLMLELEIRSTIQRRKETEMNSQQGHFSAFLRDLSDSRILAQSISEQCSALSFVVQLPALPKDTFPCSNEKSMELISTHKVLFGFDPSRS